MRGRTALIDPSSAKSSLHFPDKQGNYEAETGSLMTASTANFSVVDARDSGAFANVLQTFGDSLSKSALSP